MTVVSQEKYKRTALGSRRPELKSPLYCLCDLGTQSCCVEAYSESLTFVTWLILPPPWDVGTTINPILQMRELMHREVKYLGEGCTARRWVPAHQDPAGKGLAVDVLLGARRREDGGGQRPQGQDQRVQAGRGSHPD